MHSSDRNALRCCYADMLQRMEREGRRERERERETEGEGGRKGGEG